MGETYKMAKKVGEYTVNRLIFDEDNEEVTGRTEVVNKPIWAGMFKGDNESDVDLWGWTYFYISKNTWSHIYQFRDQFNNEKEVNLKVKDDKDYYGNKRKKLYIPRPAEQMPDVLNQLPFEWRKNFGDYEVIIERKEDVQWKTVRKEELAKAL